MRIDYTWYWMIWDEENQEWVYEWKSEEKREECEKL